MKKFLGILVLGLLWCNVVYALNFQELEKYIEKNTGTVSAIYMFERCSALTHFMYLKLKIVKSYDNYLGNFSISF